MKNLKKVLAMVLAFACTFTMFASAKVYEDVAAGSEYSEAITMLSDLGIIQGKGENKYAPEDTITRAEACALIARLMTGDPNAAGFGGAHHFKDVVKGSWQDSAIGYCVVNGVAIGVDAAGTRFEPNRPIKDKEFVTMLVRALGYETPDMKKDFPFSYMSSARAIGLLENVNMIPDTDALRGEDAQVIYNALFADYARGAKVLNTTHGTSVEKYPTIAESVWGLSRAGLGTFNGKDDEEVTLTNCKAHTWVIVGADKKEEGRILAYPIEDDTTDIYASAETKALNGVKFIPYSFKYEGDADALKGYEVELWGEGKHGKPVWEKDSSKGGKFVFPDKWTIKAIKTSKGQTKYDYDASKADSKSDNGTIELGESKLDLKSVADNAKKVTAKNTTETTLTTYLSMEKYNGETVDKNKDQDKAVEKALNIRDGAQYKLMDWDSDGDIDWIVVDEANYYKVESANSKRVTVSSMKTGNEETQITSETQTWKLDDLNDEKNYKVKYEVPEGLKEGDILEVTYKTVYDKKEKCEVVTATVKVVDAENHELDKVSTKDHLVLTFDGEAKQLAQANDKADTIVPENPSKYEDFDEEELGTQFALYMNRNGFIVYSDYATETSNYMMVLDTANGNDGADTKLGKLKILTSDNKVEKNVEVVSDLRIDGKTSGNGYEKKDHSFDESKIVGNVYKYWKDADGKITKLESMIDAGVAGNKADSYTYVSKNDRLTLDGKSYALKDAKVIFAVKQHGMRLGEVDGYIQHVDFTKHDLKVDEDDVLAVKVADIPDISNSDDTKPNILDPRYNNNYDESWIKNKTAQIVLSADKNRDIDAAVLGVNNFNKFNAGSTKVGLVTNVSYDKNKVVSIDVATNGKVDTLSSVEKTDFDDVVSVKDYKNNKTVSVSSTTEDISAGLMNGKKLKNYLNKNGAYAEITTNADGKLTGVLFMDEKNKDDAAIGKTNEGNAVIGNYYQVSRKVVTGVKEGSWISVRQGSAIYADKDNFQTMDTKNEQNAADFTSDVAYYTIDGKPTKHAGSYEGTKASILDGFDGNPKVKAGEASDVKASDIRNNADSADDIYYAADVASKIDDKGEGNVVAVYMYDDDMGEKISLKQAPEFAVQGTVTAGQDTTLNVTLPTDSNMDSTDVYVNVVDKDNNIVIKMVKVEKNGKLILDTKALAAGTYTVKLYGRNKLDKGHDLIGSTTLTVGAKQMYTVSAIEWANPNGTVATAPVVEAGTNGVFYVKVTSNPANAVVAKDNFEVRVKGSTKDFELTPMNDGVYKITIANGEKVVAGDKVDVTLKQGGALTEVIAKPMNGTATEEQKAPETSEEAKKAGDIKVAVDGTDKNKLIVQVFKNPVARAATVSITDLKPGDFNVTANGKAVNNLNVSEYMLDEDGYILTASNVKDWTNVEKVAITIGKDGYKETFDKVGQGAPTITDNKATNQSYEWGKELEGNKMIFTPELKNITKAEVQVKGTVEGVSYDPATGVVSVTTEALKKKDHNTPLTFTLESKVDSQIHLDYSIAVKKVTVAIASDGVKYDFNVPDTEQKITVELDKEYSEDVLRGMTWTVKTGGSSLFASNVTKKGEPTFSKNNGGHSVVTIALNVAENSTFKTDTTVTVNDTLGVAVNGVTANQVVVPTLGTAGNIGVTKKTVKATLGAIKAAPTSGTFEVTLDIPRTVAEGLSLSATEFEVYVAASSVEDNKVVDSSNKKNTTSVTIKRDVNTATYTVTMAGSGAPLTENDKVVVKFKGKNQFAETLSPIGVVTQ